MTTAIFLIVTILGVLATAAAAIAQLPPAELSGSLAVAFAGLAGACAAASVAMHQPDDLKEPREFRGPSEEPPMVNPELTRRVFGKLWFTTIGALALLGFVPLVALARKPGRTGFTGWHNGVRLVDQNGAPIPADELDVGGVTTVFPEGERDIALSPAMLIRVPIVDVSPATGAVQGYLAFSKVCTHAGCPVALYRHQSHQLLCPCHQSQFDILSGAKVVSGPAPRPLPQLPLAIDGSGYLIARGDFDGPVGPDDWFRVE